MLVKSMSTLISNLAIAMVMLISGLQLWWAIEALEQARRMEAAGGSPASSHVTAKGSWYGE